MLDRVGDKWDDVSYRIEGKLISIKQGFELWYQDAPLLAKMPIGFVKGIFSFVVGLVKGIVWIAKGISWIVRKILAPGFLFLLQNSLYSIYATGVKSKPLLKAKTFPESVGMFRVTFSSRANEIMSLVTEWTFNTVVIGLLKLILTPFFKIKADKFFPGMKTLSANSVGKPVNLAKISLNLGKTRPVSSVTGPFASEEITPEKTGIELRAKEIMDCLKLRGVITPMPFGDGRAMLSLNQAI